MSFLLVPKGRLVGWLGDMEPSLNFQCFSVSSVFF